METNLPLGFVDEEAAAIIYASLVAVWDKEADRFWVRSNLLLIVNGALFGLITASSTPQILRASGCLFGLYFSFYWLLMNDKGGYYVGRWRPVIEAYEQKLRQRLTFHDLPMPLSTVRSDSEVLSPPRGIRQRWGVMSGKRPPTKSTSGIMRSIIVGFMIAWVALFALIVRDGPLESQAPARSTSSPSASPGPSDGVLPSAPPSASPRPAQELP